MRTREKSMLAGVLAALALASTPVSAQVSIGGVSVGGENGVSAGASVDAGGTSVGAGVGTGGTTGGTTANVNVGGSGTGTGGTTATVNVGGAGTGTGTGGNLLNLGTGQTGNAAVTVDGTDNGVLGGEPTTVTVDLNGDGVVDADDRALAILDINGDGVLSALDDVNGDGILNNIDLGEPTRVTASFDLGDNNGQPTTANVNIGNGDDSSADATVTIGGVQPGLPSGDDNPSAPLVNAGELLDEGVDANVTLFGSASGDGDSTVTANAGSVTGDGDGSTATVTIGGFNANEPILDGIGGAGGGDGVALDPAKIIPGAGTGLPGGILADAGDILGDDSGAGNGAAAPVETGSLPAATANNSSVETQNQIGALAALSPNDLHDALNSLDHSQVRKLRLSCADVMHAPHSFSAATLAVCRVIAAL